ncbi:MAG TPA: hypothetical protein VFG47_19515, partial [Geminicoccaceae bacterium]|nr:hypothetical protein [Geminicoccaceae bacterium]
PPGFDDAAVAQRVVAEDVVGAADGTKRGHDRREAAGGSITPTMKIPSPLPRFLPFTMPAAGS